MTQDKLIRTSSGAVTKTQVVRTTTGGKVIAATTDLRTVPFVGLALNSASDNTFTEIQTSGPIVSGTINLGDGYACAVGTTVAGFPVRATDPTCVSAPNWLGFCDAHGNITINPRRAQKFYVRDFGLIPDGTTPCDSTFELMRNSMNNSPHNVVEFDEGVYRFNSTIGGTGTSAWPFGTIFQGQGVSDLFRPDPSGPTFSTKSGTVLAFYGEGVGLHIGYNDSANYGNGGAIRDIEFQGHLTDGYMSYPHINEIGIEILGDTSITIERVRVTGFKYGISLDGAEVIFLRDLFFDGAGGANGYQDMLTDLGDNTACSIRIGSFKFTVGGSANAIFITGVQFNAARYGVWHSSGVSHVVRDCNFELPAWALLHAAVNVSYENCQGEGETVASLHGKITSTGSASMFNLSIRNCFFGGHKPALKLENVSIGGLVIEGNNFANFGGSVPIIEQLGFAHVVAPIMWGGNQLPGAGVNGFGLSDTTASLTAPGTTINDILSPTAAIDVVAPGFNFPLLKLRQGARTFMSENHSTAALGGVHSSLKQVYNPNTTRIGGYRASSLECTNTASGSSTHLLGQADSPSQGGGRVTIEVEAVSESDRTQGGTWTIWQRYKDDGSGPSLFGSPTTTIGVADAGFVAPTIVVSGGKFYAQITEHASLVVDWSAEVSVSQAGA